MRTSCLEFECLIKSSKNAIEGFICIKIADLKSIQIFSTTESQNQAKVQRKALLGKNLFLQNGFQPQTFKVQNFPTSLS